MDPSTPSGQNTQNQSTQSVPEDTKTSVVVTQPAQVTSPVQPLVLSKAPVTISSGNKEGQPAMIIAESPSGDEEEEVVAAPQETKAQVAGQQGVGDGEEEVAELQPTIPEVSASPEVEKIVEKSPDLEKPNLPDAVKVAGVTHSGPGVIDVDVKENALGITKLPITYQQAAVQEKVTKLHDSKHWLMGTVMYIWRKLHPKLGKNGKTEIEENTPAAAEQIEIKKGEIEVEIPTKSQG